MSETMAMSGAVASAKTSEQRAIDDAVAVVRDHAQAFARMAAREKAALVRACLPRLVEAAPEWVARGSEAKGLQGRLTGEEWTAGPWITVRMMRLLAESLEAIAERGKPPLGTGVRTRPDGRIEILQMPESTFDKLLFGGFTGYALMLPGVDEGAARRTQASFYGRAEPAGKVALILGAGNVSSIPPLDVLSKMFVDGEACVLKMNPVNEWVGPVLERIFSPLIERGFLRIVYGGGEVGAYLSDHPGIDTIHITGSDRTHDLIVWGPPGPERELRMAENRPVNARPITSELGNVSPVAIVPYLYSEDELRFQAKNVVTMVGNNASFNCNAAKMLITARGWAQRDRFLGLVEENLAELATRKAYYPGARDRYDTLVGGREGVKRFGAPRDGELAWAFARGIDASAESEPLFRVEPFCGILSETSVGSADPVEFLAAATSFMNDRLWGTLNAMLVIHSRLERDEVVARALDRAIVELRYGTVSINHWPAVGYGFGTTAWGGHPSATLTNIQSGLGWVHNTFMLEGIEKTIVRGPLVVRPKPPWFYDFAKGDRLGPKMVAFDAAPSAWKLPAVIANAM